MRTTLGQMNGDEWEEYCQKLLRLRYDDYQEVPAQFGGDYGIEGFTRSGLVFQCYCPDEDLSGKDLYEHQRDKITKDIEKLKKNASAISKLGAGTIKEWHFLTPRYNNRELLSHCRSKEEEVRRIGLPTIVSEFIIYVKTENDYIVEANTLIGTGGLRVDSMFEDPQSESLEILMNSDNEIVRNIKTKLEKITLTQTQRINLTRELVAGYVVGQGELESLNNKFPSIYGPILKLKASMEAQLAMRMLNFTGDHGALLNETLDEYETKLRNDFTNVISSALLSRLAYEAISYWLGRCPLDFSD